MGSQKYKDPNQKNCETHCCFVLDDFLADLGKVDWSEVYSCQDVDLAAEIFTRKFVQVLNLHAPWILYQQRKHYTPWVTESTKEEMKKRDSLKKCFEDHAIAGNSEAAGQAWIEYKKLRNKVNNRKKFEEKNFKSEKISRSLDSPADTWKTAKEFYGLGGFWWPSFPAQC